MLALVKLYRHPLATHPNKVNEQVSVLVKLYLPRHLVPTDEEVSARAKLSPPRPSIVITPSSKSPIWYNILNHANHRYQGHAEIRRAKHMSPVPARATLVELPSRANSTIRRPSIPIPSPRQLASAQPIVDTQASPKAIKKEKTRSRVWGLLGLRSKKSKDLLSKATPPVGYVAPVRSIGKKDQDTLTPSKGQSHGSNERYETDN